MEDTETPRKRGRPPAGLRARLENLIDHSLTLDNWPDASQSACWSGPERVWHNGRAMKTIRALFCLLLDVDDLHPSWRIVRTLPATHHALTGRQLPLLPACPNQNPRCLNPHHYRLSHILKRDGTPVEPFPAMVGNQEIPDPARECREHIESDPVVYKAMSVSQLYDKFTFLGEPTYSRDTIRTALQDLGVIDPED